jgi:hypothetical protein
MMNDLEIISTRDSKGAVGWNEGAYENRSGEKIALQAKMSETTVFGLQMFFKGRGWTLLMKESWAGLEAFIHVQT